MKQRVTVKRLWRNIFKADESDGRFDLVCLDIHLPKKDGFDVLREIREHEKKKGIPAGSELPILMITGSKDPEDVTESYLIGCDQYIVKPLTEEKIKATLVKMNLLSN